MDISSDRIVPRRRTTSQRITNYADQLTDDDSENESPQRKRKGTTTIKYSGGGSAASLKLKASATRPLQASFSAPATSISAPPPAATTRPRPRPIFNKNKVAEPELKISKPESPVSIRSDDSELTPLASPTSPKQNTKLLPPKPRTPIATGSQKRRTAPSPSISKALPWRPPRDDAWSLITLGTYVWVLLDNRARVFDPHEVAGRNRERLWWPGKVNYDAAKTPVEVHLFGNAATGVKNIEIQDPCELNIQSLNDTLHRPRFDTPTFVTPSDFDEGDLQGSPRKKQKRDRGDLEDRWSVAVAEMIQKKTDEEEGSDDLPEVGTLLFKFTPSAPVSKASPTKSAKGTPKGNRKGKAPRKSESISEDELDMDFELGPIYVDRWSPPPADDDLTIPGELILARETRHKTTYWPARILQYVLPTKRTQEGKYLVEYLDDTQSAIPRDFFYTTDDDQFATCIMGVWKSEFKDVLNDNEEETTPVQDDRERSPSPLPCNPPPLREDFRELDIRQQFAYAKPVLQALLNQGYSPARTRHDRFIAGGKARQGVVDEAGLRGKMDPRHVAELQEHLIVWCLRDERRADFITDDGDEVEGEMSNVIGAHLEPDDTVESVVILDDLDVPLGVVSRPPSPSNSIIDLSSLPSPKDVPPPSSCSPIEEIEYPPLSLPSTSDSITDSPRATAVASGTDMDLTLEDINEHARSQGSIIPASLPRQRGCEDFEALSRREKNDYCLNVLLPEAILQILLWRAGVRTSIELLSEDEEEDLHAQGDALIKERDWVFDVLRLRSSKLRRLQRTQSMSRGSTTLGPLSVTGRPRRNVVVPKSYQE